VVGGAKGIPPFIEIVPLAGQPSAAIDTVLGRPSQINRINSNPSQMPGEFRDYDVAGLSGPLVVRFHRDRAVFFTAHLQQPEMTAEAALLRVGIDMRRSDANTRAPMAHWWRERTIEGNQFTKVGAVSDGGSGGYDMVQVQLR
jgi:hypothetical protein